MTRQRIGGVLDLEALRVLHRPADDAALAAEARRLAAQGFTAYDVAAAIGEPVERVRRWLDQSEVAP